MPTTGPVIPTARPVDIALRRLTRSANKGRLWLALAVVGALAGGRTRRAALRGVGALAATSFVANAVVKPVARRNRPAIDRTPLVRRLQRAPRTTSFPSGHAASAAAFTTAVALEHRGAGAVLAPLAAAVGYSRVHVGVHYVSDVLAGAALGAGIALATQWWWPARPVRPTPTREQIAAPALADGDGLVLVVNPRSGPESDDPTEALRTALPAAELVEFTAELDLAAELDRRAGTARAFGVAGGDGTVASVAAVALRHGLPLAVFPAGTLNHFARDVGVDTLIETARAVTAGEAVAVDVAVVNGAPFLNTAVIGAYPELVRRRELLEPKVGKWFAMALAAGQVLRRQQPVRLRIDGADTLVWTLFVGNGGYTPRGPFPAWRPRLDDGQLDIQYLRAVRWSRTRTVLATLAGITERGGTYRAHHAAALTVEAVDRPVQIATDGEAGERAERFEFGKLPGTLVVYRPAAPIGVTDLVADRVSRIGPLAGRLSPPR